MVQTTKIDVLLMEGTTLGRNVKPTYPNEKSVEDGLLQVFRQQRNLSIIFASPQNIDRIVSIFRAAKRANKTLIIDPYTAFVLDRLSFLSKSLPQFSWDGIRVNCWRDQIQKLRNHGRDDFADQCLEKRIAIGRLGSHAADCVHLGRSSMMDLVVRKLQSKDGVPIIWSYWEGYLDKPDSKKIHDLAKSVGSTIDFIHTSGHASAEDLGRLVQAVRPRMLVPIHTEHPKRYEQLGMSPTIIADGCPMEIL